MTEKLKQLLIAAGISLAFIALLVGTIPNEDENVLDIKMIKFEAVGINNDVIDSNRIFTIIDGWILNDPKPKGKNKEDYEKLYALYKELKAKVVAENRDFSPIMSLAYTDNTEQEFRIIVYNAKLMEIRENCKKDDRCVYCEMGEESLCKIKEK